MLKHFKAVSLETRGHDLGILHVYSEDDLICFYNQRPRSMQKKNNCRPFHVVIQLESRIILKQSRLSKVVL